MAQITYADKSTMNSNSSIPAINKCQASDMNEIKSVVNSNYTELLDAINDKNIICVGLSSNTNVSVGSTWTHYQVPINNTIASIGSKLTLNTSDKRIVVGSGVNYVKVSSFAAIRGIVAGMEYNIRKNGTAIASTNFTITNASNFIPSALTNMVVPVSNGDYFDITIRSAGTGTAVVAGGTNFDITIEVIN